MSNSDGFECQECRAYWSTWERAQNHKESFPGHRITKCEEGPVYIPPTPAPVPATEEKMDKKEYWKRQAEGMKAVLPEELSRLQGLSLQAISKEELKRMQLEAIKRGDYDNLYPPTEEKK